jgi:hypothetical protein
MLSSVLLFTDGGSFPKLLCGSTYGIVARSLIRREEFLYLERLQEFAKIHLANIVI